MIVDLARAIQAFVMYCVNGTSRSSLLIESTDSMIYLCRHAWADLKHRHALYRGKIPAVSAMSVISETGLKLGRY